MKGYVIENWLWFVLLLLVIAVLWVYFPVHLAKGR
jgi:hypothetical protein